MAMRQTPRGGGASTPRRPQRPPLVQPVYEDFRPVIEWKEDEQSNSLLLIYLPGFQRENLKVSTEGRDILRVKGETLIAGNKWSRFLEDYPLPEDCNVRGIRAKFESGILTIIIPKSKKKESPIVEEAITKPTSAPHKQPPPTPAPTPAPALAPTPAPTLAPAPPQKTEKDGLTLTGIPSAKKARIAGITLPNDQTIHKEEEKEVPKKSLKEELEENAKGNNKATEKKSEEQNNNNNNNSSTTAQEIKNVPDQEIKKSFPGEDVSKEGKRKLEKKDEADKKILDDTKEERPTSICSISRKRDYMEPVRKFMDLNEERQLLVNVGAAVLVIVAFGAYLSYTISG